MKLNPNTKIVEAIKNRLIQTDGFCPCQPKEIGNPDFLCPCKKYKEEMVCCCELYIKEN